MRSIGVVVYTAEEGSSCVLANVLDNEVTTARMFIDECRYIVDEATNDNEGTTRRLLLDCIGCQH